MPVVLVSLLMVWAPLRAGGADAPRAPRRERGGKAQGRQAGRGLTRPAQAQRGRLGIPRQAGAAFTLVPRQGRRPLGSERFRLATRRTKTRPSGAPCRRVGTTGRLRQLALGFRMMDRHRMARTAALPPGGQGAWFLPADRAPVCWPAGGHAHENPQRCFSPNRSRCP